MRFKLLLPLLALVLITAGCNSDDSNKSSAGGGGGGGGINPNSQPPGQYLQSVLAIPSALNDPFLSMAAPWTGAGALNYLWSFDELNVFSLYQHLALPAQEIVVAVIDTGVDKDHEDLNGRLWMNPVESAGDKYSNGIDDDGNGYVDDFLGWNFVTNMNNPADDNGHGTHVAGTIAAIGENSIGSVGVAPWVRIMALKVCTSGGGCSSSDIRAAIDYAVAQNADIINISLGGLDTGPDSIAFDNSIASATQAGVLVVVAAGNASSDTSFMSPANATHAVAVAAHRSDGTYCSFSNYGFKLDISAPGCALQNGFEVAGIVSANSKKCGSQGNTHCSSRTIGSSAYTLKQGTSMSAPHVAGMAAVALTASRTATPLQIRQALLRSSQAIQAGKKHVDYGMGKLSVTDLINEAQTAPGIKITSPRYGTSGVGAHTIDMRIEARAHNVAWSLRYQVAPFPDNVDLSAGTLITTGVAVAAGQSENPSQSWTPPAAGSYLVILEATANGEKYHDMTLVIKP